MLDHTKPYVEKIHFIDAELAKHSHKLDVKQQSLCGSGFSLFVVRMFANPHHLSELTNNTAKKRWGTFLYP